MALNLKIVPQRVTKWVSKSLFLLDPFAALQGAYECKVFLSAATGLLVTAFAMMAATK